MNREIIARGEQAKRVLELPEFQQMVKEVENEIFDRFRKTNVSDRAEREEIHRIMYACDLFVNRLNKYVTQAETEIKLAEQEPEQ